MQFMASRVLAFSRVLPSRASEYRAVAHALVGPKSGHRSGAADVLHCAQCDPS